MKKGEFMTKGHIAKLRREELALKSLVETTHKNLYGLVEKRLKFERFVRKIEDSEMRSILRLRCVECLSWEEIGLRLCMDRTVAAKKYKRFIESGEHKLPT